MGQLRSTIEEIEKSEEDAKDRQRMGKEKEMPEKPSKSPIPARRGSTLLNLLYLFIC